MFNPDELELAPGVSIAPGALRWAFSRSGGPGGQNVNKLNTRAELWAPIWAITPLNPAAMGRLRRLAGNRLTTGDEIHISSGQHRSQEANRQEVLQRLRHLVNIALIEPKPRRKTRVSRAAKRRRLENKKRRGEIKSLRRRGDSGE